MSHLTDEQLSARLDAHESRDGDSLSRHLADCAECRERLASLAELDASMKGALAHDPGDAYFASFAGRVSARIAAETPAAAAATEAPKRGGFLSWWNSPRALAWVGSAAALVAVAALALVLSKNGGADRFAAEQAPKSVLGTNAAERDGGAEPPASTPAGPEARQDAPATADAEPDRVAAPVPEAESQAAPRNERPRAEAPAPAERTRESRVDARAVPLATGAGQASGGASANREGAPSTMTSGATTARDARPKRAEPLAAPPVTPAPTSSTPSAAKPQAEAQSFAAPGATAERAAPSGPASAADAAAPAKPAADPPKASRFDVSKLFEKAKSASPAPATGVTPQSGAQGFAAPAPPAASREAPAPATGIAQPKESRGGARSNAPGLRSNGYEFAAGHARELERTARRERTATAWERAGAVWSNAAAMAPDEASTRAARRSAAEALATAWRLEPTEARRATARAAVRDWLAVAEPGPQQDDARRLEAELAR